MAIEAVPCTDASGRNTIRERWGVDGMDYSIDSAKVDFQDLMVEISKRRAVAVEGEVAPLSTRIQTRNDELDVLGGALSTLTTMQAAFDSDSKGTDKTSASFSKKQIQMMYDIGCNVPSPSYITDPIQLEISKKDVEGMIALVKSAIDSRNNQAQIDMSRLQQLVDRRDEAYSTATHLMTEISETRDTTIRNMA